MISRRLLYTKIGTESFYILTVKNLVDKTIETYDDNINFGEFENNSYPVVKQYLDNADVVQHTQHGKISGINGNCDFNFANPQLIKTIKQNCYAKPKRN